MNQNSQVRQQISSCQGLVLSGGVDYKGVAAGNVFGLMGSLASGLGWWLYDSAFVKTHRIVLQKVNFSEYKF